MKRIHHTQRRKKFAAWILTMLLGLIVIGLPAAEPGAVTLPSPATINKTVKEADFSTIVLTPEAVRRLGIETATVELRKLERMRLFGGEITFPASIDSRQGAGQSVFSIVSGLSPAERVQLAQSQIDADGQVEQARVQVEATKVVLTRSGQMLHDKVGTQRAVDDAKAQLGLAKAALTTAGKRRELLGPAVLDVNNPAGVWVRVPVYVGDVSKLNVNAEARVGSLADAPGAVTRAAEPVSAPPSANAAAATLDLFYKVANWDGAFRLGQRVGVTVPLLGSEQERPVVPLSALVLDVDGGSWIYEQTAPNAYTRRRVRIAWVDGDWAALTNGVAQGARIVVSGVAELFGAELGVGR